MGLEAAAAPRRLIGTTEGLNLPRALKIQQQFLFFPVRRKGRGVSKRTLSTAELSGPKHRLQLPGIQHRGHGHAAPFPEAPSLIISLFRS